MLKNKNIALYVCGGIASYKAVDLVRQFIKQGANVKVAMTASAMEFVTPLTFQIVSKHHIYTDTFDEREEDKVSHIHLADWTDLAVIAPATANVIAKVANGIADDFVTTTLLATTAPIFVVPAMNSHMLENPATVRNFATLRLDKRFVMEPETGFLAEGYEGKGRLPEPLTIVESVKQFMIPRQAELPLKNKRVVITAGGTKERIDPVRYITNDSSGKMGYSLASVARDLGAQVTIISATSQLPEPFGVTVVYVSSALEMLDAVLKEYALVDIVVMAAAVSDYRPKKQASKKIKKSEELLIIELEKTTDILYQLGHTKQQQFLIGFAAETNNLESYAQEKLMRKKANMIVANDVSKPNVGFNQDTNEVIIFTPNSEPVKVSIRSKQKVAEEIFKVAIEQMIK
ncbi:phosphopantothenoylcysteine decarboxylase / phosphopantothenate--cysteine ligase [Carnobacterium iners]|uniref:Coenzyme A biosynthesis bifunctional protein CoaBC n=1 Tax=Carnobacterium iners TaxID=1073423 RepID=A0A1X7NKK1_9LACT|nr:bifunctional phosphopantothenoylcysteine decarboxylase/phosphopantothenate--cysteine ligase CoaBC [Carnobacterium iners]SEK83630.1 phosphopantothenoylcysteine decarboxylase / phosphopantothenate--cysteine ligase [Carnobacterium iners]SMH37983.1 phosphopantothenoylcysteine decarboxylase / phosphopantothenate--cysteine ligase [Carnobacterium iners]